LPLQAHKPGHVHVDDPDLVANLGELLTEVRRVLQYKVRLARIHVQ